MLEETKQSMGSANENYQNYEQVDFFSLKRSLQRRKSTNKKSSLVKGGLRGIERIRTAVQAFAELRLATRPRCHFAMQR